MNLTQSLQKWGNGTGVRIPKKVIEAAHLQLNQPLAVSVRGSSIVLTPIKETKDITLESLVDGVTPEMVNGELDWGNDLGAEQYE